MAKNTNRDYLVVIDVKRSNIISQDELIFYINDNESHNIFINLVVEDTKEPMAKYVPVDDIGKYKLVINIVKPTNEYEILEAELISAEDALYQIKLPDTCMNYIGSYKCEVETHYNNRITNSNKFKYKVKKSVLNDLDNIVEAPEYPLVIQLFDKLSDINQYEEERRQNEVARIAAEIARANTFNALQNDMQDSIEAIDSKALDMENRTATMENKVNTLITDTKANLDIYKTTKDAQINQSISSMESTIDAYKNEKDQQINAAIQAQDTAIAEAKAAQDTAIEEAITTQNNTINTAISNQNTTINNAITTQNNRITTIESNNTVQNERLETLETTDVAHGTRLDNIEAVNITQNNRLTTVEAKNVEQDNRLDAIEIKNQQQDNRLLAIEKHDEKQDIDIKCLFSTVDTIDVTKEGNDITLQNSKLGFAVIDEIDGNTMVNCNKEADKTLVLNGNINTSGYSNITLTDGVDSGLVDVALEGNTMVNVCDQKDPVAITKSYTVETGNHVALQGEYDGKCRPVVTGNTLVNLAKFKRLSSGGNISVSNNIVTFDNSTTSGSCDFTLNAMKSNTTYTVIFNVLTMFDTGELRLDLFPDTYQELQEQSTIGLKILTFTTPEDISTLECFRFYVNGARTGICKVTYPIILEGDYTNKPIPDYFTGMQSSFEDKVVPENLVDLNLKTLGTVVNNKLTATLSAYQVALSQVFNNVAGKTFTVHGELEGDCRIRIANNDNTSVDYDIANFNVSGNNKFTVPSDISNIQFRLQSDGIGGECIFKNIYLVEGDYTNYDFSDYDPTKAGKYRVDYKVTGKNLFNKANMQVGKYQNSNISNGNFFIVNNPNYNITGLIKVTPGLTYTKQKLSEGCYYDKDRNPIKDKIINKDTFTVPHDACYVIFNFPSVWDGSDSQLEEGTVATSYEPYKEHTKTFYLNSPLLEGDTIEESGGNVFHVHRYKELIFNGSEGWNTITSQCSSDDNTYLYQKTDSQIIASANSDTLSVFCDKLRTEPAANNWLINSSYNNTISLNVRNAISIRTSLSTIDEFKTWLQANNLKVVAKLASPTYEVISTNDTILCDSYVNGHLDVDSVVPIEKVEFKEIAFELKYVYPSTKYTVQFESDNESILNEIWLGDKGKFNIPIIKGINKLEIETNPDTTNRWVTFKGIGFNASNIVVTEATNQDFGYFEGIKSVGECEELAVLSRNKNLLDLKNPVNLGYALAEMEGDKIVFNSSGVQGERVSIAFPVYLRKGSIYKFSYSNIEGNPDILGNTLQMHPNLSSDGQFSVSTTNPFTWDKDSGIYYARVYNMFVKGTVKTNIQLEENNIATAYMEPKQNTQTLTHEPLRAVGDVKDKYVLIDGKWYIERNCGEVVLDGSERWIQPGWSKEDSWLSQNPNGYAYEVQILTPASTNINNPCLCDKFHRRNIKNSSAVKIGECVIREYYLAFANKIPSVTDWKTYLQQNPTTVVYALASPTYEPIDYNPFTVYSDTTHISNNSTIPANMVIKNTGYNCMLKPSTTYTVSSNLGLNVVTTPSTLTEDCLRFYDSDTSTVTTMKDVLVLEGDYTVNGKPMPSHFPGIESAFEQEYDVVVGKYKVKAKVVGKNKFSIVDTPWLNNKGMSLVDFDTNSITLNTSSDNAWQYARVPLNNLTPNTDYKFSFSIEGNTNLFARVYNDNLAVDSIFEGNKNVRTFNSGNYKGLNIRFFISLGDSTTTTTTTQSKYYNIQLEQGTEATPYEPYKEHSIEFYINEPLRGIGDIKDKVYSDGDNIVIQRNCGSVTLDGSGDETWGGIEEKGNNLKFGMTFQGAKEYETYFHPLVCNRFSTNASNFNEALCNLVTLYNHTSHQELRVSISKASLSSLNSSGFRQWLSENPTTVAYQLASPTYEVIEYPDAKLLLDIFPNSTLHYENNVPVTSTVRYTYSVPLNDAVATVSDISDQQDSMIIDMATQVAVMEMMLM